MRKALSAFAPTVCALLTGLVVALGASPAQARTAEEATLVSEERPEACDRCGPAPCCMILWVSWCGCPWGDKPDAVSSIDDAASSLDGEELACFQADDAPAAEAYGPLASLVEATL